MNERTTDSAEDERLERLAIQGPLRRNAPLIIAVILALAAGSVFSRFSDSYRAVVLDLHENEMLLMESGEQPGPPRWVGLIEVGAGDVVEKERWSWSLRKVEPALGDRDALFQYERWMSVFDGVIVDIRPSAEFDKPSIAVVELSDGLRREVSLWSDDLAGARVGRRLKKRPKSWEPDLVEVGDGR